MIADAHCHFFSPGFFRALGREAGMSEHAERVVPQHLGWEAPDTPEALADRWAAELDRHSVARAMLIASVPSDEGSVATAVERHPSRFVGGFMVNPGAEDVASRVETAFETLHLSTACLFPAMHGVAVDDPRTVAVFKAAERHGGAVFVHCGVLTIGARKRLGLASPFDLRLGDPLAVGALAARYPSVPVIVPHFGAGRFSDTLMAAAACRNVLLDTSSSNGWIAFHPGLTLRDVFARALDVVGPSRLLFGTDSSFFPRGWQKPVYEAQRALLTELGLTDADQALIFGGNFQRTFTPDRTRKS